MNVRGVALDLVTYDGGAQTPLTRVNPVLLSSKNEARNTRLGY